MPRLDEEQKKFISDQFLNKKNTGKQIIEAFKEEFGFVPSASVVNKYQYYLENIEEEEEPEEEEKEEDTGLKVSKKDTRKQPQLYDFSDGNIDSENIEKLSRVTGKSPKAIFKLLKKAYRKGYTKIDMKTGDLSK